MSTEKIEPKQLLINLPEIKTTRTGIYMILCIPTGEAYIGHTRSENGGFAYRFRSHRRKLRTKEKTTKRFQDLWDTYGEYAFMLVPIEEIDRDSDETVYRQREKFYIDLVKEELLINEQKDPVTYKVSEATRQRTSKALKGKYTGPDHWLFGKTYGEERRKELSDRNKGKGNPRYGCTLSEEHKQKMADGIQKAKSIRLEAKSLLPRPPSKTGKRLSPEHVQALKDRVVTIEQKERNSWAHVNSNIKAYLKANNIPITEEAIKREFESRKQMVVQARQMRRDGSSYVEISEHFKQNIKSIRQLVTGKTWKYLPGAVEE